MINLYFNKKNNIFSEKIKYCTLKKIYWLSRLIWVNSFKLSVFRSIKYVNINSYRQAAVWWSVMNMTLRLEFKSISRSFTSATLYSNRVPDLIVRLINFPAAQWISPQRRITRAIMKLSLRLCPHNSDLFYFGCTLFFV